MKSRLNKLDHATNKILIILLILIKLSFLNNDFVIYYSQSFSDSAFKYFMIQIKVQYKKMRKFLSDFQNLDLFLNYLSDNNLSIFVPENGYTTLMHQLIQNAQYDLIESFEKLSKHIVKSPKYHFGWDNEEVLIYYKKEIEKAYEIIKNRNCVTTIEEINEKLIESLINKYINSISYSNLFCNEQFEEYLNFCKLDFKFCLRQQVRLYIHNLLTGADLQKI